MGWLHAAPEKAQKSRIAELIEREIDPELPELDDYYSCLFDMFQETGMFNYDGWGIKPLTWQELQSFIFLMKYELTPHECKLLYELSKSYTTSRSNNSKDCPIKGHQVGEWLRQIDIGNQLAKTFSL